MQINEDVKTRLPEEKVDKNESFNDILRRLLDINEIRFISNNDNIIKGEINMNKEIKNIDAEIVEDPCPPFSAELTIENFFSDMEINGKLMEEIGEFDEGYWDREKETKINGVKAHVRIYETLEIEIYAKTDVELFQKIDIIKERLNGEEPEIQIYKSVPKPKKLKAT